VRTGIADTVDLPAAPWKLIGLVWLPLAPVVVPLPPAFEGDPPLLELEPEEPALFEPEEEPEPRGELPVLVPVEDHIKAVEDPVALLPVVDVELPEMKTPPAMSGGAVLLPVLAAASLYASRVLGEGGALSYASFRRV